MSLRVERAWRVALAIAICAAVDVRVQPVSWGQAAIPQPAVKPNAYGIIIGRDTTYLTGPLYPDGTVDYAAAINAESSRGVTLQNNAACLIACIVGDNDDRWMIIPDDVLRQMGVDPKAPKVKWIPMPEKLAEMVKQQAGGPWKRSDMPELAAWLQSNKAGMDLFLEASSRSAWWAPFKDDRILLMSAAQSRLVQSINASARAVCLRAMLRLGEGDEQGACEDLAACERLAGLTRNSPQTIIRLIGAQMYSLAVSGMGEMIEHGAMSPDTLGRMDALLAKQPQWPIGGDVIPQSERYQFLMEVVYYAKGLQDAMQKNNGALAKEFQKAGARPPDWNRVMRMGNQLFDLLQADQARMSAAEQVDHAFKIKTQLGKLRAGFNDAHAEMLPDFTMDTTWLLPNERETTEAYSDRVGAVMIMFASPDPAGRERMFVRCNDSTAWTRVALALLRYRTAHGAYPDDLKALIPRYVEAMPGANTELPVRYARQGAGFILTNEQAAAPATQPTAKPWRIHIQRNR